MSRLPLVLFLVVATLVIGAPEIAAGESVPQPAHVPEPRGFLGLGVSYEEEAGQGRLRVQDAVRGGPAEQAGLLRDDLIVAVNGVTFRFANALEEYEAFAWVRPGDLVELTVLRAGATLEVELTAAETPAALARQAEEIIRNELISQQRQTLQLLGRGGGVQVTVVRDAKTGDAEFSASGHSADAFEHMELFLQGFPPIRDLVNGLKQGDQFKILVTSEGTRMNMKVLDLPLYLRAPGAERL